MTKGTLWRCVSTLLSISLLSVLFVSFAFGQESTGRILGTVTDETGGVGHDARVAATSPATPKGFEANSDANGNYSLLNVPIGVYTVTVSKTGFSTIRQAN